MAKSKVIVAEFEIPEDLVAPAPPAKRNICQEIFDETMEAHPQLVPHQETIAKIIIGTLEVAHRVSRGKLTEEFVAHLGKYHTQMRRKRPPAKILAAIKRDPAAAYTASLKGMSDGTVATVQQFLAKWTDDDHTDGEC